LPILCIPFAQNLTASLVTSYLVLALCSLYE